MSPIDAFQTWLIGPTISDPGGEADLTICDRRLSVFDPKQS
jgi:hypothetical protein